MKTQSLQLVVVVAVALLVGCGDDFPLPEPPDMQATADRYDRPTGRVHADSAGQFVQTYLEERRRLERIDEFDPLVEAVERLDESTSTTDDGTATIDGAPLRTDAVVEVTGDCPGFDDSEESGGFSFRLIVRDSSFVPVVWGEIENCRGEHSYRGETVRYEMSGTAEIFAPKLADDTDPTTALVAFGLDEYEINGETRPGWSSSFRLVDNRLEMLVVDDVGSSVVFFGDLSDETVGMRAANGTFSCNTEDQACSSEDSSSSFSY